MASFSPREPRPPPAPRRGEDSWRQPGAVSWRARRSSRRIQLREKADEKLQSKANPKPPAQRRRRKNKKEYTQLGGGWHEVRKGGEQPTTYYWNEHTATKQWTAPTRMQMRNPEGVHEGAVSARTPRLPALGRHAQQPATVAAERGWEKIRQAVKAGTREFADTDVTPREPQPPVFRQPKSKKRIEREKAERKKLAMAVLQEDRNALKKLGALNRPRRFGKSPRAGADCLKRLVRTAAGAAAATPASPSAPDGGGDTSHEKQQQDCQTKQKAVQKAVRTPSCGINRTVLEEESCVAGRLLRAMACCGLCRWT